MSADLDQQQDPENTSYARLRWRCRRGILELDLLLEGFIENVYKDLSADEQHAFHVLLDYQDQELLDALMLQTETEEESIKDVISKIRSAV